MTDEERCQRLQIAVRDWIKENVYPNLNPPGLRLEMHPSVYYMLTRNVDWFDFVDRRPAHEVIEERITVPVKVSHELNEHTWRLVTITEDVHLGGLI
jgi:hypothetical protein